MLRHHTFPCNPLNNAQVQAMTTLLRGQLLGGVIGGGISTAAVIAAQFWSDHRHRQWQEDQDAKRLKAEEAMQQRLLDYQNGVQDGRERDDQKALSVDWARLQFQEQCKRLVEPYSLHPPNSYVPNPRLEKTIRDAIVYFESGGVLVMYTPKGTGKSAAVREVVRDLQTKSGWGSMVFTAKEVLSCAKDPVDDLSDGLISAIRNRCDIDRESRARNVEDILVVPPKNKVNTVLVVDQLDAEVKAALESNDFPSFVTYLATTCQFKKNVVILAISDHDLAQKALACNGRVKIKSIWDNERDGEKFSWSNEELRAVLDRHYHTDGSFAGLVNKEGGPDTVFPRLIREARPKTVGAVIQAKERFRKYKEPW